MLKLRVPATTANMGPGFDTLGLAFALYNEFCFERQECGFTVTGCEERYANADNLAVRSYCAVLDALGLPQDGLRLHIDAHIPISRGLGSSAAMITAEKAEAEGR